MSISGIRKATRRTFPFLVRPYQIMRESISLLRYGMSDLSRVGHIGHSVGLEACSICQLKCPLCPTGKGTNTDTIGRGYLKLKDFTRFIEENPSVRHVELANWGEVLLNPEIQGILKFAWEKGVELTARSGVNLNTAKEGVLESLVKYRFRDLSVSIDGASNETYEIYRVKGDFDTVIGHVRTINAFKKQYGSEYPLLRWQFVIYGHNEHELPKARKMAAELGMIFTPKLNVNSSYSPIRDPEFVKRESGLSASSREEFRERHGTRYTLTCFQMWHLPRVNWDGKLLGCCTNVWGHYGNVYEDGFQATLQGEKYVYAKRMLLGLEKPREDIPCTNCYIYKAVQKEPLGRLSVIQGHGYRSSIDAAPGEWSIEKPAEVPPRQEQVRKPEAPSTQDQNSLQPESSALKG